MLGSDEGYSNILLLDVARGLVPEVRIYRLYDSPNYSRYKSVYALHHQWRRINILFTVSPNSSDPSHIHTNDISSFTSVRISSKRLYIMTDLLLTDP